MNKVKCINGHWFDLDQTPVCAHCGAMQEKYGDSKVEAELKKKKKFHFFKFWKKRKAIKEKKEFNFSIEPLSEIRIPEHVSNKDAKETVPTYERELKKLGLWDKAEKEYKINFGLEPDISDHFIILSLTLKGRHTANDALRMIRASGYIIESDLKMKIENWPRANPLIGPDWNHRSAYVCELESLLEQNKDLPCDFNVKQIVQEDFRMLYGCPNPKSIKLDSILKKRSIEVIDYER